MTTTTFKPIEFYGISGHYPSWFPKDKMYLVSAASLWSRERGKFIKRSYTNSHCRMFLDSGGFSFFSRWGDYPFTREEYVRLVEHYKPLLWASLDYPCEPGTVRRSHTSNQARIEATLEHLKYFSGLNIFGLVPVVQGYTLNEHIYCLHRMVEMGLTKPLMAIGSLCIMRNVKKIDEIVYNLSATATTLLPFKVTWHLLGVKLDYLTYSGRGWPWIESFDTAAWGIGLHGETRNAHGNDEKAARFARYIGKVKTVVAVDRQIPLH